MAGGCGARRVIRDSQVWLTEVNLSKLAASVSKQAVNVNKRVVTSRWPCKVRGEDVSEGTVRETAQRNGPESKLEPRVRVN